MKDFEDHSRKLKETLLKQGYNKKLANEQLKKLGKFVRDNN